jgi:hypothetical protein
LAELDAFGPANGTSLDYERQISITRTTAHLSAASLYANNPKAAD